MSPNPHQRRTRSRLRRHVLVALFLVVGTGLWFGFNARPALAQSPVSVTTTIGDIPRRIADFITNAAERIDKATKGAAAIAFKNTLEVYNARIAQEVLTDIATTGPGQQPLFITNFKDYWPNVLNSAAGDFIDEYTRGVTGENGVGTSTSDARQRFVISRILRTAIGSPVQQCQEDCSTLYRVIDVIPDSKSNAALGPRPNPNELNDHERNVQLIYDHLAGVDLNPGINEVAGTTPDKEVTCSDIFPGDPTVGSSYVPWRILPGACDNTANADTCKMSASLCQSRMNEAINVERSKGASEAGKCATDCGKGITALADQTVNQLTATDFFSAVGQLQAPEASVVVANSLSVGNSDIGKLLVAYSDLGEKQQAAVQAEQTKQSSGILPRTSKVSGVVLVPREAGQQSLLSALTGGSDANAVFTGQPGADIIKGLSAFISSPIGRVLTNFFKSRCGLNPNACSGPTNPTSALGQLLFGSGGATGIAGAQLQFAQIGQVDIRTGDPGRNEVDVTSELSSAGLIDSQFRNAIDSELTVQEALKQGLLDARKTFGFDKNGIQPRNGYSYRSLQYLRKYRITPVGWELAALYSQEFDPRDLSLGYLIKQYDICGQDSQHTATPDDKVCTAGSTNAGQTCTADSQCGVTQAQIADGEGCQAKLTPSPYCGLVDPNWVLKAPQTYCRRQGAGEEIVTKEFVCDQDNVLGSSDTNALGSNVPNCTNSAFGPDIGRWVVSRNANTCADTQSCIAENEDGTCIAFGYCVQERQTFRFDGTRCDAQYASCTTYTDASGQQNSYLASTLDFRKCNSEVAGCQWYCSAYNQDSQTWQCSEPKVDDVPGSVGDDIVRFTGNVESCNASGEGCRKFIRTTGGTNLIPNSGFETFTGQADDGSDDDFAGWNQNGAQAVAASDQAINGSNLTAVALTGSISSTIDTGYHLYERNFVGSVRAKASAECQAKVTLTTDVDSTTQDVTVGTDWGSASALLVIGREDQQTSSSNALTFTIEPGNCAGLVIDSAQVEEGGQSQYKDYGLVNTLALNKKRVACSSDDVGCEAYTPLAGGPVVNGQVRNSNRCSADDVGCATYYLEPYTTGPISRAGGYTNIVAPKGQQCNASQVGCEEYTNLDEVARGGEGKEYFQSVKQCVKPDPTATNQVTYYSWVGNAQKGFVLQAHELLQSNLNNGPCTNVTPGNSAGGTPTCNDTSTTIASCSAADLATNPDCGEFYDSALQVYYRLRSKTVTVTAACTPYRNTTDQNDNDPNNNDNVYFLSANENVSCSAAAAGCRAYTGNSGRTARAILNDTFESGTTNNWVGGVNVTESTTLGGHSMYIPVGAAGKAAAYTQASVLDTQLTDGKSYVVSFYAAAANQASDGATINAGFGGEVERTLRMADGGFDLTQPLTTNPGTLRWNENITPAGPQWQQYTYGPVALNGRDFRLGISVSGGEAFVDNVVLTEINDSLYLVQPTVPICQASEIGCAAYRDRAGQSQYLKSFNRICSEQVVGCEAMIDTQNSSSPFAQTVKNEFTPADQVVTVVNNKAAYCASSQLGCQAYGLPVYSTDHTLTGFQTVYLKNNPDRYSTDICLQNELSCKAYTDSNGTAAFFKDPSSQTCEFRADDSDVGGTWYITGTNSRCPITTPPLQGQPIGASCSPVCQDGQRVGKACVSDGDCPGSTCVGDASLIGKIVDGKGKTVYGQCSINSTSGKSNCAGSNTCVYLAGTCPNAQNGCNEYRDPSDPPGCRSECPLIQQGGSPVYVDGSCQPTVCDGSSPANVQGQNCQNSSQCGGGRCVDSNGTEANGFPGCRSYDYLRQTVEDNSQDCNGQVNTEVGCRPFNDISNPTLNFRGN